MLYNIICQTRLAPKMQIKLSIMELGRSPQWNHSEDLPFEHTTTEARVHMQIIQYGNRRSGYTI